MEMSQVTQLILEGASKKCRPLFSNCILLQLKLGQRRDMVRSQNAGQGKGPSCRYIIPNKVKSLNLPAVPIRQGIDENLDAAVADVSAFKMNVTKLVIGRLPEQEGQHVR
mmetsp:Transcript_24247/g.56889  ORF Transcript_24247/g.56889 Transcript_24247/m.56889 type:complete len:110 (+) Transcript_24247:927-1256(+)